MSVGVKEKTDGKEKTQPYPLQSLYPYPRQYSGCGKLFAQGHTTECTAAHTINQTATTALDKGLALNLLVPLWLSSIFPVLISLYKPQIPLKIDYINITLTLTAFSADWEGIKMNDGQNRLVTEMRAISRRRSLTHQDSSGLTVLIMGESESLRTSEASTDALHAALAFCLVT
ncbi:unnamed protein product [Nezara viridula]|uniref:Uncharacterized protein n=1 Tax=Nezara viridula TaxID=85310 RepID=A0A9P0HK44_NEZVI|nr:unnamed protein product [Nezara viridula]